MSTVLSAIIAVAIVVTALVALVSEQRRLRRYDLELNRTG